METLHKSSRPQSKDSPKPYKIITPISIKSDAHANPELSPIPLPENRDNLNQSLLNPQTYYLYARYNKPFTDLHQCTSYVKGSSRLQPISPEKSKNSSVRLSEKASPDSSPDSDKNPLSYLRTKIDFLPVPLWGAKHSNNASMTNIEDEKISTRLPVGRIDLKRGETMPESKRYRSVGKRINGYSSNMSTQRILSAKRSPNGSTNVTSHVSFDTTVDRNKHARIGFKPQIEKPRIVIVNSGVTRNVLEDFEEKHQAFVKNMKVLDSLAAEVSVGHEYIANCIKEVEKKRKGNLPGKLEISEEDIQKNENFREVIFHELGEILNKKLKSRKLEEKLKKSDIESHGEMVSMYLKRIAEGLVHQGCSESAVMLMTMSKIIALELEDVFTSYVIQLELSKKNGDGIKKDILESLEKEISKNKQLKVMMKFKNAVHQDKMQEMEGKYQRYLLEANDLRQQLRTKEAYIEDLLKHIKRGLTRPIPMRTRIKGKVKKGKVVGRRKRAYSDNLDALSSNESDH